LPRSYHMEGRLSHQHTHTHTKCDKQKVLLIWIA
jgi:hypothetical protein